MSDIQTIVTQLKMARDFYYKGRPILTDPEFDELENKLRSLDPDNAYFSTIGAPVVRGEKIKHRIPMGSLDQLEEIADITRWHSRVNDNDYIVSDKLDGNSIAVYYDDDGNFESAVTRGDGIEGLDITRHFRRILALNDGRIPARYKPNRTVRLEAILEPSVFQAKVTGYKNPRNYVAGQLNRTVADQVFIDNVKFVAFDTAAEVDKLDSLSDLHNHGFCVVHHEIVPGCNLSSMDFAGMLNDRKNKSQYELDGLVIEANSIALRTALGFTHLNPNYAFKFKINQNFVETEVTRVEWNPSKDGYLKPRVQFEPVDLAGVTINFATGFNAKFIYDNNIGPGAIIRVTRSGDVIPYIESVVKQAEEPNMPLERDFGTFHWSKTGVDLILDKKPDESIIKEMVEFFKGIDAPLLKEGNVTRLYEAGYTSIEAIIKASEDELNVVLGENGSKVFMGLRDKLANIDEYILAGSTLFFGRGIGRRKMKKLAEKYGELSKLTYDMIIETDGFDDTTAAGIANGVPLYVEFLKNIKEYVSIKTFERVDGPLSNIAVCFTGVRSKDLERIIEANGGKVLSSVTKDTTHLVAKDPHGKSGKLDKARKQGVEVISLEEAQSRWSGVE